MGRTIFIGDVHGMLDELQALIAKLKVSTGEDRLVFVGDLVDKGPDSLGVLRYVRELGALVVIGNHEEKALRFYLKGKLDQLKDQSWVYEAAEKDWAFIESMPLTWFDPELNIRVVHGGIFPALLRKHPDAFAKIEARGDKWRKGGGKALNRARRMLRVRFVGGEHRPLDVKGEPGPGDMLALHENKPGDPFWADVYDGSQGFVIYGHSPQLDGKPRRSEFALGVDTAAVFGAKLTAAVVQPFPALPGPELRGGSQLPGGLSLTFVSVEGRQFADPIKDMGEE